MGNAAGSKPGIGIKLNHENYFAGSTLTGTINLHVRQNYSCGGSLRLTVEGEERTCVVERTGQNGEEENADVYHRSKRQLIYLTTEIVNFDGEFVSPGSYGFPFSFQLPTNLPTTMYCSRGPHHCQVEYVVRAQLYGPSDSFLHWDEAKASRPFYLSREPKPHAEYQEPIWVNPAIQKVNFCCCFSRGSMSLGAVVERGIVDRGEPMSISFACRNNSKSRLKGVQLQLLETTKWKADSQEMSEVRTLANCYFDETQVPGTTRDPARRGEAPGVAEEEESLKELYDELVKGGTETSLPINHNARDSFIGQLIEVTHTLSIVLCTSIFITSPKLDIPIYVQSNDPSSSSTEPRRIFRPTLVLPEPVPVREDVAPSAPPTDVDPTIYPECVIPMNTAVLGGKVLNHRSTNMQAFTHYAPQAQNGHLPRPGDPYNNSISTQHGDLAGKDANNSFNQENEAGNNVNTPHGGPLASSALANPDDNANAGGFCWLPEGTTNTPSYPSSLPGAAAGSSGNEQRRAVGHDGAHNNGTQGAAIGTLPCLHSELDHTVDHFGTVMRFCEEPSAQNTLASLKPQELGSIIARILPEYNQPAGAQMLVRKITNGPSCIHCIAAINAVKGPTRTHMVKQVAPLCHDLRQNRQKIEDQLSDFELLLCKEALYPEQTTTNGSSTSTATHGLQVPAKTGSGYVVLSPMDQA